MTIVEIRPFSGGTLDSIQQAFLATGDAMTALAERTAAVDRLVADTAGELLFPSAPTGLALLAVGGYGRRQMFPYSDVDLLLLFETDEMAYARKDAISAFLQRLWDAGLRMSHSVRTTVECATVHDQNIELNISLLDQRFLAGDRALYAGLAQRLPKFIHANREALTRNLTSLTRERHEKFANTFYHLEPNLKEAPGGMRDYQLVCWLAQIRETQPGHLAIAAPPPELQEAFRFLARQRCYLHCQTGRDANLLSFDAQDAATERWHVADAAIWMREYYRHSRAIYRAAIRALEANEAQSSSLFAQFKDWRSRLSNADFTVNRGRVNFRAPHQIEADPELVLRLFAFIARHGVPASFTAMERIEAQVAQLRAHFGQSRPLWPALNEIFSLPHAPLAVRAMHETGTLSAIFPEMEQIECLVIRDFFHRYTVDEHTLVAIQKLWDLRKASDIPFKFYGDLMAEDPQPGVLVFALLFHDVGKGTEDEGPVDASLRHVAPAMARIHMPQQDREMVNFLIGGHLELSAAMNGRDLYDPHTVRDVTRRMATVEHLKALTLLTFADISAVNPTTMTPWRAEQLWQLYLMVNNELTRELETDRIEAAPAGPPKRVAFLLGFPTRYLRTHTEQEIDEHTALEERSRTRGVAVEVQRLESAYRLTMVTSDHPGLFASVAGVLSSFGMNILKAEAFSNKRGLVLDTFTFADLTRTLELNPTEVDRLRTTAERVILGKTDVRDLLRNRPKPTLPSRKARIPATVSFDPDASASATLVEIVAEDRPGLLYDLASAISSNGANIELVLIDTEAHKAIDVFYVTAGGKKLDPDKQAQIGEAMRLACQPTH